MDYGTQVLSHPMIVDAARDSFVPVCVYNNTEGDEDQKVLKHFGERSWNNPVVRFLNEDEEMIVPRIHKDWSLARLAAAMTSTLKKVDAEVPGYLELLATESTARKRRVDVAVFGMA